MEQEIFSKISLLNIERDIINTFDTKTIIENLL